MTEESIYNEIKELLPSFNGDVLAYQKLVKDRYGVIVAICLEADGNFSVCFNSEARNRIFQTINKNHDSTRSSRLR